MAIKIIIDGKTIMSNIETNAELFEMITGKEMPMDEVMKGLEKAPKNVTCKGYTMNRSFDNSIEVTISDLTISKINRWTLRWVPVLIQQAKMFKAFIKPVKKMFKRIAMNRDGIMKDLTSDMMIDGQTHEEWMKARVDEAVREIKIIPDEKLVDLIKTEERNLANIKQKLDIENGIDLMVAFDTYKSSMEKIKAKPYPKTTKILHDMLKDAKTEVAKAAFTLAVKRADGNPDEIAEASESYANELAEING